MIRELIEAGTDVVRLNFSHGDHTSHARLIRRVRAAARAAGRPVSIIQDLQGPRFRIGPLSAEIIDLRTGARITISARSRARGNVPGKSNGPDVSGKSSISIEPAVDFTGMRAGQAVLIGDEGIELKIASVRGDLLSCRVVRGGRIRSREGVNFPHAGAVLPSLMSKDIADLKFGVAQGVDFVALSFVRSARDMKALRRRLGDSGIPVIAKIETEEAIRNIAGIIDASDAIMVGRGDLAKEVSMSQIPVLQKFLIERCNEKAKPVITATQMLESMMASPEPTRAEATDVANAVLDGSDALMLSGETAAGRYPAEAVRMMDSLVRYTERAHDFEWIRQRPAPEPEREIDEMIAYLAAGAARSLGATAIITFTTSGRTALRVAKFRPSIPIVAVTPSRRTKMMLVLSYGTVCLEAGKVENTDRMIAGAIAAAKRQGIVRKGDTVAVTAGVPTYVRGKTNLLKLEVV